MNLPSSYQDAQEGERALPTLGELGLRTLAELALPTLGQQALPTLAELALPTLGEPVPPTQGEPEPPTQGEPEPPTQGESVPPTKGESVPPKQGESVPPTKGESVPPTQGESVPPTQLLREMALGAVPTSIIRFLFCPDPGRSPVHQGWYAILEIQCHNLERLMLDGFSFDATNVIRGIGPLPRPRDLLVPPNFTAMNKYRIIDNEMPIRWMGKVKLFAVADIVISWFSFADLTRDRIHYAQVTRGGEIVYNYDSLDVGSC
ncbi:hypothetical protein ONZ43_g4827 [Nemania bipapillata]|uniref:Uncharacterized protein n=1 Tax=Nemania bipapillata TaxID=110536 RepID=A0ACC2II01_9PEZI|nr:hypothetical protein ONZ43_g4827 [Nemania bipapillata]